MDIKNHEDKTTCTCMCPGIWGGWWWWWYVCIGSFFLEKEVKVFFLPFRSKETKRKREGPRWLGGWVLDSFNPSITIALSLEEEEEDHKICTTAPPGMYKCYISSSSPLCFPSSAQNNTTQTNRKLSLTIVVLSFLDQNFLTIQRIFVLLVYLIIIDPTEYS